MSVGSSLGEFYADDGLIGSRDPECLQGVINTLIVLFPRVVLMFNVEKIQDNEIPNRVDLYRDGRGGLQSEYHWVWLYITGATLVTHHVSRLWGGFNGWIHDGTLQTIAWNGARYLP